MPFFSSNRLKLYYEVTGRGEPLLLINGLSGDTRTMAPLAERLKDTYTVINFDMRCAGQSDKPNVSFTIADLADDTFSLIEHLGYSRVSVMGFSMGGMVAMELFRRNKGIVSKLILVSTTPSLNGPFTVPAKANKMLHRTDVSPALLKEVYDTIFGSSFKKAHSFDEYLRFRMEDANPQPASAYLQQLNACESFNATKHTNNINIPTLIIAGDEDGLVPHENSKWLNKTIPGSKLFILKGIGHMAITEAPEAIAKLVSDNSP